MIAINYYELFNWISSFIWLFWVVYYMFKEHFDEKKKNKRKKRILRHGYCPECREKIDNHPHICPHCGEDFFEFLNKDERRLYKRNQL